MSCLERNTIYIEFKQFVKREMQSTLSSNKLFREEYNLHIIQTDCLERNTIYIFEGIVLISKPVLIGELREG